MYIDDIYAMTPVLPEDSILLSLPFAGAVLRNIGVSRLEVEVIMEDVRKANIIDDYYDEDDDDDVDDHDDNGNVIRGGKNDNDGRSSSSSSSSDNIKNRRRIGKFGLIDIFRRTISATNSPSVVSSSPSSLLVSSSSMSISNEYNDVTNFMNNNEKTFDNKKNKNNNDNDILYDIDNEFIEVLPKKDAALIEG